MELVHESALRLTQIDEKWFSVQEIGSLIAMLRAEGMPCRDLLAAIDLEEHDLADAHKPVSARQRIIAYRYARLHSKDRAFALHCGSRMQLASHGIWGYALMCSSTLGDALDFGFRYLRLAGPLMQKSLHMTRASAIVRAQDSLLLGDLFPFALEVWWSSVYSGLHTILGDELALSSLSISYPAPAYASEYERIFRCPIRFGAPYCEMEIPKACLSKRPVQANLMTAEVCKEICSRMLFQLEHSSSLVTRVRNLVLATPSARLGLDEVADKLHMSARNLRRKLKAQGTSYLKILAETRSSLAKEYLATTDLGVAQIASLIGFSDAANFQAAFKQWTQQTPAQFRKSLATRSETARSELRRPTRSIARDSR
jgi:AraC-like DNA-binding protein